MLEGSLLNVNGQVNAGGVLDDLGRRVIIIRQVERRHLFLSTGEDKRGFS